MPIWSNLLRAAAVFNWLAGLPLLLTPAVMLAALEITAPDDLGFHRLSGLLIVIFGAIYWMMASEPMRYRPLAKLGVAGKAGVVAIFLDGWMAGRVPDQAAGLALGDLAFGLVFAAFLWATGEEAI